MKEKIVFNTKKEVNRRTSVFKVGDIISIQSTLTDSEVSKKAKVIQITDALIVVEYTRSKIKESFVRVQLADAKILVSAGMESSTWT